MILRGPWSSPLEPNGLLDVVKRALDARGFDWTPFEDKGLFGQLSTPKATYRLFVMADESRKTACFYLLFPIRVPEPRRVAVAELCTRANWRIFLGSLEMDFASGDLRWRCALDVDEGVLSEMMVQNMIWTGAVTLDNHHDALLKVIVSGVEPGSALETAAA